MGSFIALISIGANLPDAASRSPLQTCRRAAASMDMLPHAALRALSRWFATAPVPRSDQPDYVNAVAVLRIGGELRDDPARLLRGLQRIEVRCGRVRGAPNAARTLDLDIIAIDNLIRSNDDPILPHPRAHQRAFVLRPLLDVAPGWLHPVLHRSAAALLAELPPQPIRPLRR